MYIFNIWRRALYFNVCKKNSAHTLAHTKPFGRQFSGKTFFLMSIPSRIPARSCAQKYRSLGEGCPNGKFSEERCVCVRARGLCDGEVADARWANPGLRVYCCCCCCCSCPDLGLGFVSVLSRFCLGVVSPHLPQTPYHPTGGVIGIYI